MIFGTLKEPASRGWAGRMRRMTNIFANREEGAGATNMLTNEKKEQFGKDVPGSQRLSPLRGRVASVPRGRAGIPKRKVVVAARAGLKLVVGPGRVCVCS